MSSSKSFKSLASMSLVVSTLMLLYQGWDMLFKGSEPILTGYDDTGYFLWLNSWVADGDNNLSNNLKATTTLNEAERKIWLEQRHPSTGKVLNKYPIGWAVVNWPAYQVCFWIYHWFNESPSGLEPGFFLVIWINQLLIAALGLMITYRILRQFLEPSQCKWAIAVVWLSSPLLYYQVARLGLVHNQAFFLTTAVVWLSLELRHNDKIPYWLFLGFFSGLLLITRPTSVCYLIIPAVLCFRKLISSPSETWRAMLYACLAGALPLLLQMYIWKQVYGNWLVYTYFGEPFFFSKPAVLNSLFSDRHGLFNWHPFLLAGLTGLLVGTFRRRLFPVEWLASLATIIYINSAWWCWWFGSSFGNRAYEGVLLFFMAGIGYLKKASENTKTKEVVLHAVAYLAIIWNLYLLFQYMTSRFDRTLPVSYLQRLYGWF